MSDVLLTNHAMPRQPIEAERVRIELSEAPAPRAVWVERIEEGLLLVASNQNDRGIDLAGFNPSLCAACRRAGTS